MPRFPTRTLILMVLALGAFVWMWTQTHRAKAPPAGAEPPTLSATPVQLAPPPAGGDR